jgi:putative toxin-antitoxin system antitoxin component (TIGR02293 family)
MTTTRRQPQYPKPARPAPSRVAEPPTATYAVTAPESGWTSGAALGLRFTSRAAMIERVRSGLPVSAIQHLSRQFGMPLAELAADAGIALRTLARRKKAGRLQPQESERVLRVGALFDMAAQALGGAESARRWFTTPNQALGGKPPLAYCDTELGAREVEDLLGRLEHGVFA